MTSSNKATQAHGKPETDSDRLVRSGKPAAVVDAKPLVDETATESAISPEAHRASGGDGDPVSDPTVPMRAPGGDHANESPVSALASQPIEAATSNDQLRVAADKRAAADGGRTDAPQERRTPGKTTAEGK